MHFAELLNIRVHLDILRWIFEEENRSTVF